MDICRTCTELVKTRNSGHIHWIPRVCPLSLDIVFMYMINNDESNLSWIFWYVFRAEQPGILFAFLMHPTKYFMVTITLYTVLVAHNCGQHAIAIGISHIHVCHAQTSADMRTPTPAEDDDFVYNQEQGRRCISDEAICCGYPCTIGVICLVCYVPGTFDDQLSRVHYHYSRSR